jgi:hypothetical protein
MFNLLCYVHGDDYKHAFIVKIEEEEAVATLKEAIKQKTTQTFCNIDADSLTSWNASVSFNRALKGTGLLTENKVLYCVRGQLRTPRTSHTCNNTLMRFRSPLSLGLQSH